MKKVLCRYTDNGKISKLLSINMLNSKRNKLKHSLLFYESGGCFLCLRANQTFFSSYIDVKTSSPSRVTCVKAAVKTSGEFVVKPSRQKTTLNMARGELGSPPLYARLVLTVSTSVFQTEGGSSNLLSCSKTLHKKVKRGDFFEYRNQVPNGREIQS